MEDAHAVQLDIDGKHTALFGVFDGHAGKEVAAYCARHIVSPRVLLSSKLNSCRSSMSTLSLLAVMPHLYSSRPAVIGGVDLQALTMQHPQKPYGASLSCLLPPSLHTSHVNVACCLPLPIAPYLHCMVSPSVRWLCLGPRSVLLGVVGLLTA
jgi:hypothetical protein